MRRKTGINEYSIKIKRGERSKKILSRKFYFLPSHDKNLKVIKYVNHNFFFCVCSNKEEEEPKLFIPKRSQSCAMMLIIFNKIKRQYRVECEDGDTEKERWRRKTLTVIVSDRIKNDYQLAIVLWSGQCTL